MLIYQFPKFILNSGDKRTRILHAPSAWVQPFISKISNIAQIMQVFVNINYTWLNYNILYHKLRVNLYLFFALAKRSAIFVISLLYLNNNTV
jgi:hypothetical protein